ncbi:TfoX/Sxy family protein [Oricola sp.]|uniref:TfoX/Sxy family protein n=1 Tax=Oricola sp. TaxID=1979950 RepID=UPI003BA87FEC
MAFDEQLARRMRDALGGLPNVEEKRMMGGACFMIDGNMIGGAHRDRKSGEGLFMFRVGKQSEAEALAHPGTTPMIHAGRKFGGFIHAPEKTADPAFADLLSLSLAYVGTLPPKPAKTRKAKP